MQERRAGERGYAMAALLVGMSIMAIAMSMLLPAWRTMAQREREAELVFRGEQYARAIRMYNEARQSYPPDLDVLVREKFLRKKYKDPITNDEFQVVRFGQPLPGQAPTTPQRGQPPPQGRIGGGIGGGAIVGVVSKSTATSFRVINGRTKYNEIAFVPTDMSTQAGSGGRGANQPGAGGAGGGLGGRGTATPGRGTPLGPSTGGRSLQLPGSGNRGASAN